MAQQPIDMPIDPEFDRNIEGMDSMTPEDGMIVDFEDQEDTIIEEQEDGSV